MLLRMHVAVRVPDGVPRVFLVGHDDDVLEKLEIKVSIGSKNKAKRSSDSK